MVVVLCGIANHDNVGGIFRNAAAFGASAVILDSDCCDPLYRKAIRVSVGAALTVPFARLERGEDALGLLAAHGFEALALTPGGDVMLTDIERPERVAVLFGTEGTGLPEAVLARTRTVRIPMAGELDSLNVATASGIVLHHLAFGQARCFPIAVTGPTRRHRGVADRPGARCPDVLSATREARRHARRCRLRCEPWSPAPGRR